MSYRHNRPWSPDEYPLQRLSVEPDLKLHSNVKVWLERGLTSYARDHGVEGVEAIWVGAPHLNWAIVDRVGHAMDVKMIAKSLQEVLQYVELRSWGAGEAIDGP